MSYFAFFCFLNLIKIYLKKIKNVHTTSDVNLYFGI